MNLGKLAPPTRPGSAEDLARNHWDKIEMLLKNGSEKFNEAQKLYLEAKRWFYLEGFEHGYRHGKQDGIEIQAGIKK